MELGRRLLNQALEEFSLSLRKVPAEAIDALVRELGLRHEDELFEKIGLGERLAPFVARRLLPADADDAGRRRAPGPLAIAGTEGLVVTYARCCFPIPNDPIIAYLSSGRGVVIHREACGNLVVVPQAAGEVDPGHLAGRHRPPVPRRDQDRGHQPHGRARAASPPPSPARRPTSTACRWSSATPTPRR